VVSAGAGVDDGPVATADEADATAADTDSAVEAEPLGPPSAAVAVGTRWLPALSCAEVPTAAPTPPTRQIAAAADHIATFTRGCLVGCARSCLPIRDHMDPPCQWTYRQERL
jgi:hypothetical protein